MGILEMVGLGRKVRYAIVGVGDIAQENMMPGVKHTGNSTLTALVTSDPEKARDVAAQYEVEQTYSYEQFEAMLAAGTAKEHFDAIYLATPNWRHAEFAVPALKAGIHVLVEKPLEISSEKCQEIIAAEKASDARLMVAYRLHFEPATLKAIEHVRSGLLGRVHMFSSVFAQTVSPDNHRAQNGYWAGPVFDMGPYPVNAVRNLFGAEPETVFAIGSRHPESGMGDFDDTVTVTLQFPGGKIAQFVVSYFGNTIDTYTVVGTKGSVEVNPAYMFGAPLHHYMTVGEEEKEMKFPETDHFGGEMKYFSDCILHGRDPEPDAEEGLADVRVIEAIGRSLESGQVQKLTPFSREKQIDTNQAEKLSPVKPKEPVHAASPSEG